jgi:protein LSM14
MPSQAAMDEAARQAKEAVAAAMAKLNPAAASTQNKATTATAVDALTKKVSEMSTTASNGTGRGGRGGNRGGRGNFVPRGGAQKKMEIPKSDFDFETANAKFNKEDLIKEAIASGSPLEEPLAQESISESAGAAPVRKDSVPSAGAAYNKSSSFFDNISSEAKDREEATDTRANGRQVRSEEFKKNIETFGQGNVDGGYRGRGRGGGFGRGRQYGGTFRGNRGYGGYNNYRGNRARSGQTQQQVQGQAPADQAAAPS